jgi:hypothetical protein
MSNRTAWTAGNGQGLTWGALFNGSDINSCINGDSVLSSVSAIANGTNLDQFMDVSLECTIASSTIAAGANFTFWIFPLNEDGTTYGDNSLTAGTAAAITPGLFPAFVMPLRAAASQTALYGFAQAIVIPPGSFACVVQNNCGFTLSSSGNAIKYRTYNIQLNN